MSSSFRKPLLFIFIYLSLSSLTAQDLQINTWQSLLPISLGNFVTQSEDKIIYASENQLILIDKHDGSVEKWSKVEGLSDVALEFVKYHTPTKSLIIAYQNSNIDIIQNGRIRNFSAIKDNLSISGDKRIFNVSLGDKNNVFFSCGFGLVEFFLDRLIFGATLLTPIRVNDFEVFGEYYYLATDEGLYRINPNNVPLLSDFGLWESIEDLNLSGVSITDISSFNNKLYAGFGSRIYSSENGQQFNLFFQVNNQQLRYLSNETKFLSAGFGCSVGNCTPIGYSFDLTGLPQKLPDNCFSSPRYAIEDQMGRMWFADNNRGFRNLEADGLNCNIKTFNAPYSSNVSEMEVSRGRFYIASGGTQPNGDYLFREDGFFMLEDNIWHTYNKFTVPAINALDLRDFFKIKAHPTKDIIYIGNYLAGLIEWKSKDDFKIFDQTNSSLGGTVGDFQRTRVSGLAFDRNENLWISNFLAVNPFSVYTKNGEWKNFPVPGSTELQQVIVDDFGNKWFGIYRNGILVFNEGSSIENSAGHKYRQISTANSLLPSNNVNCLAKDLDGAIWVGTDQGILVFECGSNPFQESCRGTDRRLEQDGYGSILLSTETIRAIEIDGANRKWIGTSNGLFVQSSAGDQAVYNFTTSNSPLLDNNVIALKADLESGNMYIASNRGVQVIRTNATGGNATFQESVYAFPNPVRPDYDGPIAIKGLARDANFKITDLDGRLVFEGRANGGQAIWDGRDFSGRKVDTGVYLVFATYTKNIEFPSAHVAKIAFIR
jgi:hypothetical protein